MMSPDPGGYPMIGVPVGRSFAEQPASLNHNMQAQRGWGFSPPVSMPGVPATHLLGRGLEIHARRVQLRPLRLLWKRGIAGPTAGHRRVPGEMRMGEAVVPGKAILVPERPQEAQAQRPGRDQIAETAPDLVPHLRLP